MKRFILILTAAAAGMALPACKKDEAESKSGDAGKTGGTTGGATAGSGKIDEKAALEVFKAQALAMKAWAEKNEPDKTNPAAGMAMIGQMVEQMKGLKTEGLPADLKTAVANMVTAMGKMEDAIKDFPKDPEGFMKFMTEKATADPEFGTKFQAKMETVGKEVEAAGKALKEAGDKYGLDLDMKPDK